MKKQGAQEQGQDAGGEQNYLVFVKLNLKEKGENDCQQKCEAIYWDQLLTEFGEC